MILIIGLGNPGKEYESTRHNVGALIIERLLKSWGIANWKEQRKLEASTASCTLSGKKVMFVRPRVFMNESGRAVFKVKTFYKLRNENIWVIHDELDMPFGKFKISFNRSAAGHNGVSSIVKYLKENNFYRWRVGIGNEKKKGGREFVLSPFAKEEKKELTRVLKTVTLSLETALSSNPEKAMNEFNA